MPELRTGGATVRIENSRLSVGSDGEKIWNMKLERAHHDPHSIWVELEFGISGVIRLVCSSKSYQIESSL